MAKYFIQNGQNQTTNTWVDKSSELSSGTIVPSSVSWTGSTLRASAYFAAGVYSTTRSGWSSNISVSGYDHLYVKAYATVAPSKNITVAGTAKTLSSSSATYSWDISSSTIAVRLNLLGYMSVANTAYGYITDMWATKDVTLTYDANGGSDAPGSQIQEEGTVTLSSTTPTRTGYTFLGWSTDSSATTADYYSGGNIDITDDTTLYAVWKANSYTLTTTYPHATVTILKNGDAYTGTAVDYGDVLTISYTPSSGYVINTATVNGTSFNSGDTYTVTGATTIVIATVAGYSTIATYDSVVETLGTFSLTVNQYDASHYCKLRYYDSNSNLLATSAAFTTSTSITIPQNWFANFASVTSLTITAELTTYTDSSCTTQTGLTDSCTFTVTADSTMKPTLSAGCITLSEYNTGTGVANLTSPGYVKGYSKVQAVFDESYITHASGASTATYAIIVQNTTTSGSTTTLVSSNKLTSSGTLTITYKVTDSRGRSTTGTDTISVNNYAAPSVSAVVKRTDSSGTEDDSGTYMTIVPTATYTALSDNAITLTLYLKASGGSYTSYGTITDGATTLFGSGTLSPDTSYVVKVVIADTVTNSSYVEISMPKRSWEFHIGMVSGSSGAAFGKVTEYGSTLQLASGWSFMMGSTSMTEADLTYLLGISTKAFTVTLASASWSSNQQTVSNAYFLASGYAYTVAPESASYTDYGDAGIYAEDVSTDGQMVFHCTTEPSADITVNILRVTAS